VQGTSTVLDEKTQVPMLSYNDGFRPVSFLLEVLKRTRRRRSAHENCKLLLFRHHGNTLRVQQPWRMMEIGSYHYQTRQQSV
jgi:hypothetical protein